MSTSHPTTDLSIQFLTSLDSERFKRLTAAPPEGGQIATILLPMEVKGAETRKNRIAFKNALAELRSRLKGNGGARLGRVLEELECLDAPTHEFWQHQHEGLALVIREDGTTDAYGLPFAPESRVHLGEAPYLTPLARLIGGFEAHVLVLDLDHVRLFYATRWRVQELKLEHTPLSLDEAMATDDPEKSLQFRSVSSSNLPGEGGGTAAFHGHGITGDETRRKRAKRFFEQLDNGVRATAGDNVPLVLCGPDDEIGLYREVNHHPKLSHEAIRFNASNLDRDELHRRMREWVIERDDALVEESLGNLQEGLAKAEAVDEIGEIVRSAKNGRIAVLFVETGARLYGIGDETGAIVHDSPQPGDEELLGRAAHQVASQGGRVHFLDPGRLANGSKAAAILRY